MLPQLKAVFIRTRNVRNFEDMMTGLERNAGEGRMAAISSIAGYGKTRAVEWWHANHPKSVYLRVLAIWRTSERAFLRALLKELDAEYIPFRKDDCFNECAAYLKEFQAPVFLDEMEKLPPHFLEIVRDLTDVSGAPFVLVGEEELLGLLKSPMRRRVWSRTLEAMKFEPLGAADIIAYAREAAEAKLPEESATIFHSASKGDFRIMKRDLGAALRIASSKKTDSISPEIARNAVNAGIRAES